MIFAFSSFSFDAESGDLTQNGLRVPINQQTAKLLAILLRRAGRVVTREEIRAVLWPSHEIENPDQAINNGIGRLRYIFRDDPQKPEYIERVPKRGYRLIVEVTPVGPSIPAGDAAKTSSPLREMPRLANFDTPSIILDPSGDCSESAEAPEALATIGTDLSISSTIPDRPKASAFSHPYLWKSVGVLVAMAAVAAWWYFSHWRQAPGSIALGIASFEASDPRAEELSESFRLDLADSLAQLPRLKIRAIHSTERLRLGDDSLQREAARLGLDAILFGHVIVDGNKCHLLFELVNAHDGMHLSSFQYEGTREELTSMRDKIQQQVFTQLKLTSSGRHAVQGSTQNADAYEAYLQGRSHLSQQTEKSLRQAIDAYNAALAKDPSFAMAYTGLARAYLMMTVHYMLPQAEGFNAASNAANKARQIDPSSAEVHGILGLLSYYRDWNLQVAQIEEREAIRLDPNQAVYHQWLAAFLCAGRQCKEAIREVNLAHACDPDWPPIYITEVSIAHRLGDNSGMLESARNFVSLWPDSSLAHDELANALWYDGRKEDAIVEWRKVAIMDHDSDRAEMEDRGLAAFHRGGITGYARVRLDAIRTGKGTTQHPSEFAAEEWYVAAGEPNRAIAEFRRLLMRHDPLFIEKVTDPIFVGLHTNPAFRTLITESGVNYPE